MLNIFWFSINTQRNMTWLEEALQSLHENRWTAPLYIVGAGWPDVDREAAALSLIRALALNRSTKTFILQNAGLDAEKGQAITDALNSNTSLVSVTFRNLTDENGQRYSVPAELFRSSTIRSVSLTRCRLSLEACQALGEAIRERDSLSNLYLSDVEFDPAGRLIFFASMCLSHALKSLTVRDLHWDSTATRRFLTILASNTSIESLQIERMASEEGFARDIAYLVSRNRVLRSLSIRENDIHPQALRLICEDGLSQNKGIEKLFVSHNPIGVEGAEIMMDLLKKSSNIKDVCFALTCFGPEGCKIVAKNLPECVSLRRINLDGNQVDDCGQDFLEALQKSYNVVSLFDCLPKLIMKGLSAQLEAWKEVDVLLRGNKAKRRFFQNADEQPDAVVPLILQSAASEPDVMFHFLQNLGRPMQTTDKSVMAVPRATRRTSISRYAGSIKMSSQKPRLVQRVSHAA
mmetsp:Transcript_8956/g.17133  ORF Transcript_8956/g.17133 Transcript_8956/m.17133 type:complete len:462 (+) Transcript_8956:64-1449(+)